MAGEAAPPPDAPPPAAAPEAAPALRQGELISVVCALALLVAMFALKWYGLAVTPSPSAKRAAVSSAEDAWNGLTVLRWLMLLTIAAALGSVAVHAGQRSHGVKTDTSRVISALGTLTGALLVYRVLIVLPTPKEVVDQKIGAYLGLLATIGIALGGYESVREEQARARTARKRSRTRHRVASGTGSQ